MTTWKSRAMTVFSAAIVVFFLSGNSDALGECGPATSTGTYSCGDTLNLSGYATSYCQMLWIEV